MLQLGGSGSGSLAGPVCKPASPLQGTDSVQMAGGTGITNYQLSKCSKSGKVTRFSQSRPCLRGTAPTDSIRSQVWFSRSVCLALLWGLPSKANVFGLVRYKYIPLTFIFKLFCWIYCSGISPPHPHSSSRCIRTFPSAKIHFYNVCIIPLPPPTPITASICTNWKGVKCIKWQAGFRGQLSAVPGTAERGGGAWRPVFLSKRTRVCSATKNVLSKKIKLLRRRRLAWLHNTHQGSLI